MICSVMNGNRKLNTNEILCVIIVISSTSIFTGAAEKLEDSLRINRPILRNSKNSQPWAKFSTDYVRCFCNLPSCVHTGYMCKSVGGGCFSDLWGISGFPAGYRGRHGCLELLDNKEKRCVNMTETLKSPLKKKNLPKPYIHCCYDDMCNHVDSPQTRYLINSTLLGDRHDMRLENVSHQRPIGYSNSEVWFRAATIAVPICGAVILFVLVALAVKILRNERDSSYNHKLGPSMMYIQPSSNDKKFFKYQQAHSYDYMRNKQCVPHHAIYRPTTTVEMFDYHQRQFHVPLLVQNEIGGNPRNKNEAHAKLNQLNCDPIPVHGYLQGDGKSIMLEIEKDNGGCGSGNNVKSTACSKNNLDRDKNINEEVQFSDLKYGDKNYTKDSPIA